MNKEKTALHKQLLCMFLALSIVFSMAACKGTGSDVTEPDPQLSVEATGSETSVATEYEESEAADVTEEETTEETTEVTEDSSEETEATEESEVEATEAPSESTGGSATQNSGTSSPGTGSTGSQNAGTGNSGSAQTQPTGTTPPATEPPVTETTTPATTAPAATSPATEATTAPPATEPATTAPATQPAATTPPATENSGTHTHSYVTTVVAPSCTADGYTLHECSCGDSYTSDVTQALTTNYQHILYNDWYVTKQPTTEEEGEQVRYCKVCGIVGETESIPRLSENETNETLDVAALMAYGNSYAASIGFTVGGSPASYFPASTRTFTTMAAAKADIAGNLAGLKEGLINTWGSIDGVGISVVVVDLGNGSYQTTVYYG